MRDTIDMAREAGLLTWLKPPEDVIERFKAFEYLVRADEREQHKAALLAERNIIAALVEQMGIEGYGTLAIAAAIRTKRIDK
jgi:hypothetical protein